MPPNPRRKSIPRGVPALALCLIAVCLPLRAATVYIDPSASGPGNGSLYDPFTNWFQPVFAPGNTYLQRAGTTATGIVEVQVAATGLNPVRIGRYGSGNAPVLVGEFIVKFSAHVTIEDFEVRDSEGAGVQISANSEHIVIRNLRIYHCAAGIELAADTLGNNLVTGNVIYENDSSGVAILGGPAAGPVATVSGNTIYRNGLHGVQVRANYCLIDGNEIHTNGLNGIPGTSGIHIYSPNAQENSGDFNIIRNNRISNQQDLDGFDGNGIQSDHFCDNNQIHDNVVFENDGAGVFLHDAQHCSVRDNVLYGNMRDRGTTRQALGDICLTSKLPSLDRVTNNTVSGNVIVTLNSGAVPVFVDSLTLDEANIFGNNGFCHQNGGDRWWAGPDRGTDMAAWNAIAAGGGNDYAFNPAAAGFIPPAPPPAYMLDTTFTRHSAFFQTILPNTTNVFLGGAGADAINGENLADVLVGHGGNDTIDGKDGDDWVVGSAGDDTLLGNHGTDLVLGGFGNDMMDGGPGDDSLAGGDGADVLTGAAGFDQLFGGTGDDQLYGGDGDDALKGGTGDDLLVGGLGDDSSSGGPGHDRIDESGDTLCGSNTIFGDDGDDVITGGCGDESITGGDGADAIDGGPGDDHIDMAGDTTAQNTAAGGDGNDTLLAGELGDTLQGDAGDDTIVGGSGPDIIFEHVDPSGLNLLIGNAGADTIYGGGGPDQIYGNAGVDLIDAGAGDDRIYGGPDSDIVIGGDGQDYLSGGTGSDQLHGGGGNDILLGSSGDDTMSGGTGDDTLDGSTGDDVLDAGDGADVLFDGPGNDRMTSGAGADNYYFNHGSGQDTITDFSATDVLAVAHGVNGATIETAADLWNRLTDTAEGALLDLGGGNWVLLEGITAALVNATQNLFVQDPVPPPTVRTLSVPEITFAAQNGIVSIPVSLDDGEDVVSLRFSLLFNPDVVEFLGHQEDGRIAGWDDPELQETAGVISFDASGAAPIPSGGALVWLQFKARANPTLSFSSLTFMHAELNDSAIPVEFVDGEISLDAPPAVPVDSRSALVMAVLLVVLGVLTIARRVSRSGGNPHGIAG